MKGYLMNDKVTIKTIAKIANVSHTTVSRALNDSPLVKEKTKKEIREIAERLNYSPNLNAKALVEHRSFIIAVYFTDLNSVTSPSFMSEMLHQIKEMLPKGYEIAVDSFASLRQSKQAINLRFDGALVVSQSSSDDIYIEQLAKTGKPIVILNRKVERTDLFNYASDDYSGTVIAVEYLLRMGHQKIGLISGKEEFTSSQNRLAGFLDTLQKHNISRNNDWIVAGDYSVKSGYDAMEKILNSGDLPTCIFASNDDMAMGAMRACEDYGFNVPNQISFMGFDDSSYSNYCIPRLTTIKKPMREITNNGIKILNDLINNKSPKTVQSMNIKPSLVVRESVKKLN